MSQGPRTATVGKCAAVLKHKFESWYSELINPLKARSALHPREDQPGGVEAVKPRTAEEQEVSYSNSYE